MSYLIYARKYRPMTFEEMIGQGAVVQTLVNAIKSSRVAQAYIFSGMRGVGKTTAARIMAKALNCQNGPTPTPCNTCDFCMEVNEDRSVDVIEIDGASNRGIEEVRSLREGVKYRPIHCRSKVIIIDEVHMLTREAFNALLKTLEEPPPHTVFIFATTEFHKVPATIVSRCQHFEFKKISHKDIINHLLDITKRENITISSYGLKLLAEAAEGSLRDVQSLLDQAVAFSGENIRDEDLKEILGIINRDLLVKCTSFILDEKPGQIFPLVDSILSSGYDLFFFYRELIEHFRQLLLVKTVENPQDLVPLNKEDFEQLESQAGSASAEDLLRYLLALQDAEQGLKFSTHPRIRLETILVKLSQFKKIVPLKDILERLDELRGSASALPLQKDKPAGFDRADPEPLQKPVERPKSPPPEYTKAEEAGPPTAEPDQKIQKKVKRKEVDIALKDPTVQNFMKTFKAQILSVNSMEKTKK